MTSVTLHVLLALVVIIIGARAMGQAFEKWFRQPAVIGEIVAGLVIGALGVLMNTRGLMELVVLTIGLDMGILPPTLFTTLVLMAIVTTLLTAPLFTLVLNGQRVDDIMPASTANSAS